MIKRYEIFKRSKTQLSIILKVYISKRSMWKSGRNVGHAPKVLNATNKSPVQATATTFPSNADKIEEELDANRKLPTGIDFYNNATDQTSTTQDQHQTYSSTEGRGSFSKHNSGMLGMQSPHIKTTLNTENSRSVPNTYVRGYVTPPPSEGYTVYNVEKTKNPDPKKPGKDIEVPNVVDSFGQEIPHHEASHMIIRDNQTGKDVGVFTSNKNAKFVASHNVENKIDKNGKPQEQRMRIYEEPRDSQTASAVKEYKKGTAFAKQYDAQIDKHVVDSGITNKIPTKRVNRDSAELLHENGYAIFDANGKEIEYDFNPNLHSPVSANKDVSQPSYVDNAKNNEEKND